jgi:hypothetical protein
MDYNIFKMRGIVQSLDLSAGTGLFSSINNNLFVAEKRYSIDEIKPNRSWTSVLGAALEFSGGFNFSIEGYYKYLFDRMYVPIYFGLESASLRPQFDGTGRVWGIDLMVQKAQSRYWDGWISWSFNWAKYRDPGSGKADMGISGGDDGDGWYFPSYHRFNILNLVLNIKPAPRINIYTRFGIASGVQLAKRLTDKPVGYPVYVYADGKFIEKYHWPSVPDENNRSAPAFPLDIKVSFFGKNKKGKVRWELYVAIENMLALMTSGENSNFNQYTGESAGGMGGFMSGP